MKKRRRMGRGRDEKERNIYLFMICFKCVKTEDVDQRVALLKSCARVLLQVLCHLEEEPLQR
jgi:hypothetical protein